MAYARWPHGFRSTMHHAERSASLMPAVVRLTELQLHTAIFAFTRVPDDVDYASVARFLACETLADVRAHFSDVAAHDAGETSPHAEAVPSLLTVVAAVRRVVIVVGAHTPGLRAEVAAVHRPFSTLLKRVQKDIHINVKICGII